VTGPMLVVIRGNSGSGKTTTAREVRRRYGRGCALLLEQDYLRRIVLREHDSSRTNPVAPAFITATARNALDLGYHVVLEGILHTDRYANVLHQLIVRFTDRHEPHSCSDLCLHASYMFARRWFR
jgi:predicted kinase